MTSKPWYQSTTVWFNVLAAAALILGAVADNALSLGLPVQVVPWITLAIAVVNILIRVLRTSQPLEVGSTIPSLGATKLPPH